MKPLHLLLLPCLLLAMSVGMGIPTLSAEDAPPAADAPKASNTLRGEITAVSPKSITVKVPGVNGAADTSTTLAITADTKLTIDKMPVAAEEFKVGDKVFVKKDGENAVSISVRRTTAKK